MREQRDSPFQRGVNTEVKSAPIPPCTPLGGYEPKGSRKLCIVMDLQGRRRRGTDVSAAAGEFLALPYGRAQLYARISKLTVVLLVEDSRRPS